MPPKKVSKSSGARFLKPSIDWAAFKDLVNPEERTKFLAFKGKSESYLRRVQSNPESAPKIDWDAYKKIVPDPSVVDKLKSAYESFKIPYPGDTLSGEVDAQWQALSPKIEEYCTQQVKIVNEAKKELDRINNLPAFDVITMEMFADLFPDQAIHPVEKPTFWPHTEDEQLGYVYPEQKAQQGKKQG